MKTFIKTMILLCVTLPVVAQDAKPAIKDLKWLSGCWQMNDKGKITTEKWSAPTSNAIIGLSQTVVNDKTVAFEFLRIVDNGHGMVYVAKPSDAKNETGFFVKSATKTEVIFENLKHDFPQRIIYRRQGAKSLFARIEGMMKDKLEGMDFPYTKVKCE